MTDAHMHQRAGEKNPIPFWRGARSSCHLSDRSDAAAAPGHCSHAPNSPSKSLECNLNMMGNKPLMDITFNKLQSYQLSILKILQPILFLHVRI